MKQNIKQQTGINSNNLELNDKYIELTNMSNISRDLGSNVKSEELGRQKNESGSDHHIIRPIVINNNYERHIKSNVIPSNHRSKRQNLSMLETSEIDPLMTNNINNDVEVFDVDGYWKDVSKPGSRPIDKHKSIESMGEVIPPDVTKNKTLFGQIKTYSRYGMGRLSEDAKYTTFKIFILLGIFILIVCAYGGYKYATSELKGDLRVLKSKIHDVLRDEHQEEVLVRQGVLVSRIGRTVDEIDGKIITTNDLIKEFGADLGVIQSFLTQHSKSLDMIDHSISTISRLLYENFDVIRDSIKSLSGLVANVHNKNQEKFEKITVAFENLEKIAIKTHQELEINIKRRPSDHQILYKNITTIVLADSLSKFNQTVQAIKDTADDVKMTLKAEIAEAYKSLDYLGMVDHIDKAIDKLQYSGNAIIKQQLEHFKSLDKALEKLSVTQDSRISLAELRSKIKEWTDELKKRVLNNVNGS